MGVILKQAGGGTQKEVKIRKNRQQQGRGCSDKCLDNLSRLPEGVDRGR